MSDYQPRPIPTATSGPGDAWLAAILSLPTDPRGGIVFGSGSGRFSRRNQAVAALLMRAGPGTVLGNLPGY
jgi:hypothetical protein